MPGFTMYPCDNFGSGCDNYVYKAGLCQDCKDAARKLDLELKREAELERMMNKLEQKPRRPSDVWGK